MVDKYYTPSSEEFCVDFEYEWKGYSRRVEWCKLTIDESDFTAPDIGGPSQSNFSDILNMRVSLKLIILYMEQCLMSIRTFPIILFL